MIKFNAYPLEKYSSYHRLSLLSFLGVKAKNIFNVTMIYNFNYHDLPLKHHRAQLKFKLRDTEIARSEQSDFCIKNLTRWRLDISTYHSFEGYIKNLKSNHKKNYLKTQQAFIKYGATISYLVNDWSELADTVYQLYCNVANRHGVRLYDIHFFREIAKSKDYKLMCVWHENKLISTLIIFDEEPVLHSMLCGFDYSHSKHIHAYSLIHYELIRIAIESKKYSIVDIGVTADKAKSMMNFKPISSCMDIYSNNYLIKAVLRMTSKIMTATINEHGKLIFKPALRR